MTSAERDACAHRPDACALVRLGPTGTRSAVTMIPQLLQQGPAHRLGCQTSAPPPRLEPWCQGRARERGWSGQACTRRRRRPGGGGGDSCRCPWGDGGHGSGLMPLIPSCGAETERLASRVASRRLCTGQRARERRCPRGLSSLTPAELLSAVHACGPLRQVGPGRAALRRQGSGNRPPAGPLAWGFCSQIELQACHYPALEMHSILIAGHMAIGRSSRNGSRHAAIRCREQCTSRVGGKDVEEMVYALLGVPQPHFRVTHCAAHWVERPFFAAAAAAAAVAWCALLRVGLAAQRCRRRCSIG